MVRFQDSFLYYVFLLMNAIEMAIFRGDSMSETFFIWCILWNLGKWHTFVTILAKKNIMEKIIL